MDESLRHQWIYHLQIYKIPLLHLELNFNQSFIYHLNIPAYTIIIIFFSRSALCEIIEQFQLTVTHSYFSYTVKETKPVVKVTFWSNPRITTIGQVSVCLLLRSKSWWAENGYCVTQNWKLAACIAGRVKFIPMTYLELKAKLN